MRVAAVIANKFLRRGLLHKSEALKRLETQSNVQKTLTTQQNKKKITKRRPSIYTNEVADRHDDLKQEVSASA